MDFYAMDIFGIDNGIDDEIWYWSIIKKKKQGH